MIAALHILAETNYAEPWVSYLVSALLFVVVVLVVISVFGQWV